MIVKSKEIISFLKNHYIGIFTEEYILKNKKIAYFIPITKTNEKEMHVIFHHICTYFNLKISNVNATPIISINKDKKIRIELHNVLSEKNYLNIIGFNLIIKEI